MVPVCGQRDGLRPEPGSGGLVGSGAGGVPTAIPLSSWVPRAGE